MEILLEKLGHELVNSPYLSVMILDKKYQIVWHNQRFADEMNQGNPVVVTPCFQAVGSDKVHANCPTQQSIETGESSMACLDQGDVNFLYMTIPLDDEHAAKVHIVLPKQQKTEA